MLRGSPSVVVVNVVIVRVGVGASVHHAPEKANKWSELKPINTTPMEDMAGNEQLH